ncbi:MAG TPA: carboxypeptidase-like regulatory domain-containing protein, partial [Chryseolinea sp.]
MRYKVLAGCFLLFLAADIFAQTGTIKGVAINSRTYERLPFASAFINNTTIGTSANEKGEFVLKNIPIGQHELVVTFVGHHHYQSLILIKDTTAITITVRLKSTEMREVKVNSKRDKNWQRQYEKFKKLFLGNTVHALRCEILNP